VFEDVDIDDDLHNNIPAKLTIPKTNRPDRDRIDDKTMTYCEMVSSKLRNFGDTAKKQFYKFNNLTIDLRKALADLSNLVNNKNIVICKSDKDGKIIIVDFKDYNQIMRREMSNFDKLSNCNTTNINKYLDNIRTTTEKSIINLHKLGTIDDTLLKHVIGFKCYHNGAYKKIPGINSKYFNCYKTAYAYPLFKTHKILPEELLSISVHDIPIRLLQSAGFITTSRVTAFLENLLNPISIEFCQFEINEYCRDSKQYLIDLTKWKSQITSKNIDTLYINTADVKSLYPNISRELVKEATTHTLKRHSCYTDITISIIVDLILYCLNNVVVQHESDFYTQNKGIITGDNHSVSLANITLHFIILPIAETLNKAIIFKRFIDDITWIADGEEINNLIITTLTECFKNAQLELHFKTINTTQQGNKLEFLDVEHNISQVHTAGFYTQDYIKPTAVNRLFINGASFHPPHLFKAIVYGEATRLRRINEDNNSYIKSLNRLKKKCLESGFNKNLTTDIINKASDWKERFHPPSRRKEINNHNNKKLIWATPYASILRLNKKERNIKPNSMIVYKKPTTIGNILTNYQKIAHNKLEKVSVLGGSHPCNKCALCGNHGKHKNMINSTNYIYTNDNIKIKLKQNLNCSNYGIYSAQCNICKDIYVGQTKNKFSVRWSSHRHFWNNNQKKHTGNNKQNHNLNKDRAALFNHFLIKHKDITQDKNKALDITDCYNVIFLQEPTNTCNLDFLESKWISKLKATININKTIIPEIK